MDVRLPTITTVTVSAVKTNVITLNSSPRDQTAKIHVKNGWRSWI